MRFIRSIRRIKPLNPNGRIIVYMHGYGGYSWMAARQLSVLERAGYEILALDFVDILRAHDPQDLVSLMDEVAQLFQDEGLIHPGTLIVGISLGGLVGYNLLRRYPELDKLLVITGGDISRLPWKRTLRKRWKLTRSELARRWEGVNMYTPVGQIRDKRMIMFLPLRDKLIDPEEVTAEIAKQGQLNDIKLIRTPGGHFQTIISQTVISPAKILPLLRELEQD